MHNTTRVSVLVSVMPFGKLPGVRRRKNAWRRRPIITARSVTTIVNEDWQGRRTRPDAIDEAIGGFLSRGKAVADCCLLSLEKEGHRPWCGGSDNGKSAFSLLGRDWLSRSGRIALGLRARAHARMSREPCQAWTWDLLLHVGALVTTAVSTCAALPINPSQSLKAKAKLSSRIV
jgi:hypothetical protein